MIIIDYGLGNLASIHNMLKQIGSKPVVSDDYNLIVEVIARLMLTKDYNSLERIIDKIITTYKHICMADKLTNLI